jgi:type II secretory pathway component PulF
MSLKDTEAMLPKFTELLKNILKKVCTKYGIVIVATILIGGAYYLIYKRKNDSRNGNGPSDSTIQRILSSLPSEIRPNVIYYT